MDKIRGGSCKNCDESGHTTMDCPKIKGGGGYGGIRITKDTRDTIQRLRRNRENREMPQLVALRSRPVERDIFSMNYDKSDEPLTIQVEYKSHKKSTKSRDLSQSDLRHTMNIEEPAPHPHYKDTKDLRFEIRTKKSSDGYYSDRKKSSDGYHSDRKKNSDTYHSDESNDSSEEELLQDEGVQKVKRTKRGCAIQFNSSDEDEEEEERGSTPDDCKEEADISGEESSSSSSSSSDEAMASEEKEEEQVDEKPSLVTLSTLKKRAEAAKRDPPTLTDESDEKRKPPNKRSKTSSPREEERHESVRIKHERVKHESDEKPPSKVRRISDEVKDRERQTKASKEILSLRSEGYSSFSDNGDSDEGEGGMLAKVRAEQELFQNMPPLRTVQPKSIVPIFPFKTQCKPAQYPESKVPYIDSHCHIDYLMVREQCYGSFASYVQSKEFPKNFSGCVSIFCDPPAWGPNQMYEEILEEDGVWAAFGLHPHNASRYNDTIQEQLVKACSHPKCVAWGEMGLDYGNYHQATKPDEIEAQKEAFISQIKQALRLDKPFVIHGRGAEQDAFEILKNTTPKQHRIHFHCYSGMWSTAQTMLRHFPNMYLGITGLVTYSTASDVREVARKCPLDRILVETDAPYMKPSQAKDVDQDSPRTANPGMGIFTAQKIAEIRKLTLDEVLTQLRDNVKGMYGI